MNNSENGGFVLYLFMFIGAFILVFFITLIFNSDDIFNNLYHSLTISLAIILILNLKLPKKPTKQRHYNEGISKARSGDYKGAIEAFTIAIDIEPDFASAYFKRGNIKLQIKDYKGAIQDYTNAIEYDKNNAEAHFKRGYAKILSNENNGCADFYKAKELGYKDPYDLINKHCK